MREIKDEVEKRAKIPRKEQCLVSQGKPLQDEMKIEGCDIKEGTTIEMTLRFHGGTIDSEMMNSAGTMEERQVKRITSEPCSEISGIEDVKLSDITDHKKKRKLTMHQKDRSKGWKR